MCPASTLTSNVTKRCGHPDLSRRPLQSLQVRKLRSFTVHQPSPTRIAGVVWALDGWGANDDGTKHQRRRHASRYHVCSMRGSPPTYAENLPWGYFRIRGGLARPVQARRLIQLLERRAQLMQCLIPPGRLRTNVVRQSPSPDSILRAAVATF